MDSLIDLVSFGICPAIVLLSYGNFNLWFMPGTFLIIAAGVLRLSYFNVFGLIGESAYQGLAIDNNAIVLVLLFGFEGFVSSASFTSVLYFVIVALALLNIAPIKTPKLGGWYLGITIYTLLVTVFFGWQLTNLGS